MTANKRVIFTDERIGTIFVFLALLLGGTVAIGVTNYHTSKQTNNIAETIHDVVDPTGARYQEGAKRSEQVIANINEVIQFTQACGNHGETLEKIQSCVVNSYMAAHPTTTTTIGKKK